MTNTPKIAPQAKKGTLFSSFERALSRFKWFGNGIPVHSMPRIIYFFFIALIYIGCRHAAERMTRKADRLQLEVEELRAQYITTKAALMFASKQSEIAKKVRDFGLQENTEPPYKITISAK